MELKEYLRIIGKRIWILVVCVIIITLASFLFTRSQPIVYYGSLSGYILVTDSIATSPTKDDYFKYDNYYALQASTLFADTIVSWIQDPVNVSEIYQQAQVDLPTDELKKYARLFSVRKGDPATIYVTLNSKNKNDVETLLSSTKSFLQTKTQSWLDKGLIKNVAIDFNEPIVVAQNPQVGLNSLIGVIAGIIVGLALIFFTDYMLRKD